MPRKDFSKAVQRAAYDRAKGHCEACGAPLTKHKSQVDHVNPDGLTGQPVLENAQVLCTPCHLAKTKQDVARISKAKRNHDADNGIRKPGKKIKSRGFDQQPDKAPKLMPQPRAEISRRYVDQPS